MTLRFRLLALLVLALPLLLPLDAEAQRRSRKSSGQSTKRESTRNTTKRSPSRTRTQKREPSRRTTKKKTSTRNTQSSRSSSKKTPTKKTPSKRTSNKRKTPKPVPKKVAPLHRNLRSVREKRTQVRAEIRQTRKQAKVVKRTLWQVDASLMSLGTQLKTTVANLHEGRRQQRRVARELVKTTRRLEEVREQVRQRIKAHTMQPRGSVLSVLAGTRSASELASRTYLINAVERKDQELFDEYQALRRGVARRKAEKDAAVRRVARLERRQRGLHANLRETRAEKKEVLDDLRARHAKLQAALRQFEADERQIANQIAAFEAMMRRRALEAARRRARMRRVARRVRVRTRSGRIVEKVVTRMEREPVDVQMPRFTGRFGRPVNGRVTSGFGVRFHPILRTRRMHTGVDMGASYGSPIYAAADGVVVASTSMRGYGNVVIVSHGGGVTTVYAHASRLYVSAGQRVRRGQSIAAVGSTGLSTGPHLHFEVRINGRPVNPLGRL